MTSPNHFEPTARAELILAAYQEMDIISERAAEEYVESVADDLGALHAFLPPEAAETYIPFSNLTFKSLAELLQLYDQKNAHGMQPGQLHSPSSFIFDGTWGQFTHESLVPAENEHTSVAAMLLGGDVTEDGLFKPDHDPSHLESDRGIMIECFDPAAYIAISAIRRLEGSPRLDGFTHFAQLPVVNEEGRARSAYIVGKASGLILGSSPAFEWADGRTRSGVRFSASTLVPVRPVE